MNKLGIALIVASLFLIGVPLTSAEVCQKAQGCEFWDDSYHEYILYSVDTATVDVLIVPPVVSPYTLRDIATAEMAVQAWEDGVMDLGASWMTSGFSINHYTLGVDTNIPPEALSDPEIIVVMSEHDPVLLFGIGLQLPASVCTQRGGMVAMTEPHEHNGITVYQAECTQGGRTCVALNTNFLLGGRYQMYDLVAHEFGHCLGVGHVGDALDFDAKSVPDYDIMSYQYNPSHVHCVSTLNVRSMESVYADLLGGSGQLNPGAYYTMAQSSYSQVACDNIATGGILG